MTALPHQSLGAFVEAMAADRPAPGAGSAAGVCLAMAAACAAKAFRISARHAEDETLAAGADRAEALARAALAEAQRDMDDFTALIREPDGDAEQALKADGEALLALTAELLSLVETHRAAVIATMAGDVTAALALGGAAERIQRRNLAELS